MPCANSKLETRNSKLPISKLPAFSLLEVLIATLILGIGLIMVAAIFPVGATWSRQGAEETIAQNLALNAVSIIKTKYAAGATAGAPSGFSPLTPPTDQYDAYYSTTVPTAGTWQTGTGPLSTPGQRVFSLPHFETLIPVSERTYAVGTDQPFPVRALVPPFPVNRCIDAQYFWTALMKVPDDNSTTITLYILVCRRADRGQYFSISAPASPGGLQKILHCRNETANAESLSNSAGAGDIFTPSIWKGGYLAGALTSGQITGAWPAVGSFGIGANSGTVFRQSISLSTGVATPMPALTAAEPVITAIPPTGWPDSPLIYIYQTQLSF